MQTLPRDSHAHFVRLTLVFLVLTCSGCSRSPTSPTTTGSVPLAPGSYVLTASAVALGVPSGSDCQGTGAFAGVALLSYVTLGREGTTWVVRSESADDGDAELRFVEAGVSFGAVGVNGIARGTARDLRSAGSLGVATITFAAAGANSATLSGGTSAFPTLQLSGWIRGSISVATGSLGNGTCAQAMWTVRKPFGCEINRGC